MLLLILRMLASMLTPAALEPRGAVEYALPKAILMASHDAQA